MGPVPLRQGCCCCCSARAAPSVRATARAHPEHAGASFFSRKSGLAMKAKANTLHTSVDTPAHPPA